MGILSLVVAMGFSHLGADGRRLNVNRPTESVPGTPARLEAESEDARRVYEAYRRHVAQAAQGPLRLYVEVHGNAHKESAGRLEIATVGLSREDAWRLKTLFELIRDSRLDDPAVPRLEVWVESLDPVRYTASAAKQAGMLAVAPRALHIELPRAARTTYREIYTELRHWPICFATSPQPSPSPPRRLERPRSPSSAALNGRPPTPCAADSVGPRLARTSTRCPPSDWRPGNAESCVPSSPPLKCGPWTPAPSRSSGSRARA